MGRRKAARVAPAWTVWRPMRLAPCPGPPHPAQGHVARTCCDNGSIIRFLTRRFALEPLPGARAGVGGLAGAVRFD